MVFEYEHRLVSQHKNELKSVVVDNAYSSQRTTRMVIRNPTPPGNDVPNQLPAHRRVLLGKASLSVSVTNDRPPQAPPMTCRSIAGPMAPPPPSSSRSVYVNPSFLAKGKVAHEGSVHINPNFFKATQDAGQVAPTLMCKSVHINPRLLRAGGGATMVTGPAGAAPKESTVVPAVRKGASRESVVPPAPLPSNKPHTSLVSRGNRLPKEEKLSGKQTHAQKVEKCAGTRGGLQMPLKAPSDIAASHVPAPPQPSVTASDLRTPTPRRLPSSPARTPSSRRKYAVRSKTKLVKAPGSSGKVSRTTPHGSTLLSLSRTKLVRLPGRFRRVSTPRADTSAAQAHSANLRAIKAAQGTTLMSLSRTKLVRMPEHTSRAPTLKSVISSTTALPRSPAASSVVPTSTVTKTRYRLQRTSLTSSQSPTIRLARKVSTKYKFRSSSVSTANTTFRLDRRTGRTTLTPTTRRVAGSRFKVDHRAPTNGGRVRSHLLLSPLRRTTYSAFCNRVWAASPKLTLSFKRLSRIGNNPRSRNNQQNSALVRIGGLLYKSSRNKLILSKTPVKAVAPNSKPKTVVKRRLSMGGQVVYVRGDKFVLDRSGKTMQRIAQDSSSVSLGSSLGKRKRCVSRIDIGGMTFVQKSPNVLVRTNIHRARNVVSNAKQKSIAFLAKKMRKINTPCLFYRRFGRCPRQEKGRCEHVHDPKCIDICKKFLQGNCCVEGCLLSHDVGPEKMPTCRFFLEGCCVKDNCPYLHVKVSDRAPICRNFLRGYCTDGPECLKRHILLCPEFDEKGSCSKGKCPFPHNIAPLHSRATCSDLPITKLKAEEDADSALHSKRKRYYETDSVVEDLPQDTQSDENSDEEAAHFEEVAADSKMDDLTPRKRPKIGDLPSFISLE